VISRRGEATAAVADRFDESALGGAYRLPSSTVLEGQAVVVVDVGVLKDVTKSRATSPGN
jgi:hypothetical protein